MSGVALSEEEYDKALTDVVDIFAHAEVILLGTVAKAVHDRQPVTGDTLEVAVDKLYMTDMMAPLVEALREFEYFNEEGCQYKVGPITLNIKFIDASKHLFLARPDKETYAYDEYFIPNPFNDYWEHRNEV